MMFFFTSYKVNNDAKIKRNYFLVCGLILFLFLSLRSRYVGSSDTLNYYNMMKDAIRVDNFSSYYREDFVEPGFQFFVYILSRFFKDPQWMIVISSLIFITSICYFIYRNSEDIVFSLTMYITLGLMQFQMQGMRQAIAMSVCLFAYECAKKRKLFFFILLVILAMQFHRTAIVFLIVYFLPLIPFNYKGLLILVTGSLIFVFSVNQIVSVANELFDSEYSNTVDSGGFIALAIYVLIILSALIFNKKLKFDKNSSLLLYVTILGGLCYFARYIGAQAAERISFYFMFGQIALLPNTVNNLNNQERAIVKLIAGVLMLLLFAYRLSGSEFIPFEFFWQR